MRVIAGKARGTKLQSIDLPSARPTLDRVKESIFSTIQYDLKNKICLDAFACSGSLGIEALSRGALKVDFCERDKQTYRILKDNIKKTRLLESATCYNMDIFDFLIESHTSYDFVFLDPPYNQGFILKMIDILLSENSLNKGATIVAEHEKSIKFDEYSDDKHGLCFIKRKDFSDTSVTYFKLMH